MKIKVDNVSKIIKGQTIFEHVNIELHSGNIYGFVGYNGCGKTMLLRILANLIKPTEGSVSIDDIPLHQLKEMPDIGIILEKPEFFDQLSGYENLTLLAQIKHKIQDKEIQDAIYKVGLKGQENKLVGKYSLGMKQRLGIAQSVMEDNQILILDEVTSALDEDGVAMVYDLLSEERKRHKLIVITSHNRSDIENLCDEVYTFRNGEVCKI